MRNGTKILERDDQDGVDVLLNRNAENIARFLHVKREVDPEGTCINFA